MKNKYTISEANIRMFNSRESNHIVWHNLSSGKEVITITGNKGSTYNPYIEWKLKPNGDGTFSAYRLS